MNTEAIELICEKLGTTINELVPSVVSYGIHSSRVWLAIGFSTTIIGIYLLYIATRMRRSGKYTWADDAPDIIGIIGIILLLIGIVLFVISMWELHKWYIAPELTAYKEIAGWFR